MHIGTSGWVYAHWRGLFYPQEMPQREWFAHYAGHFQTVELNASFYRMPKPETLRKWREQAPRGFIYAVKANRFITHLKRLRAEPSSMTLFFDGVRELGRSLGPILYQLPPNMKCDAGRLDEFASGLPGDLTHVFEFRDPGWFRPEIRRLLEARGLGFCIHDHRDMEVPRWATSQVCYWRFHGDSGGRQGGYSETKLRAAARQMRKQANEGHAVYAYFNNDAHGCAIRDADRLIALAGKGKATRSRKGEKAPA
jgi:uncharacterized protein YecE (DUF72 family)